MTIKIENFLESNKNLQKSAIIYKNNTISYSELYEKAKVVSEYIINTRINYGKNIGIYLPNSINYAISYFGITFADKVIVPIHYMAKFREVLSTIEYCEMKVILTDTGNLNKLLDTVKECKYCIDIIIIDKLEVLTVNSDKEYINLDCQSQLDDVAIMLHTSGTTSNPKRVMLTHNNLYENVLSNIESLRLNEADKTLITLPMCFGYCNTAQFLTHIYLGATIVIMEGLFLPKRFYQIVEKEKITNYTGVPSTLILIKDFKYKDNYNIDSLKFICFGGGVMPVKVLKSMIDTFPDIAFLQTYGQTEASPRLTLLNREDYISKVGSVGKTIPNVKIKLTKNNLEIKEHSVVGNILASGPNIMKGYYKRPDETEKVLTNGWLNTGDLGYFDRDGYLYIVGRVKNIIISSGINIYPEEVEEVLLSYPGIRNALVVGLEDKVIQEKVVAYLVIDKECNNFNLESLQKYCIENLATYKLPKEYFIVDNLDKTISGKVKRYNIANVT